MRWRARDGYFGIITVQNRGECDLSPPSIMPLFYLFTPGANFTPKPSPFSLSVSPGFSFLPVSLFHHLFLSVPDSFTSLAHYFLPFPSPRLPLLLSFHLPIGLRGSLAGVWEETTLLTSVEFVLLHALLMCSPNPFLH